MSDWLLSLYADFFGSDVIVAPEYLLFSLLIAWAIYRWRHLHVGFWRWLAPPEIYTHKSHILDLQLFIIGRLMMFSGLFGQISLTTLIAAAIASAGLTVTIPQIALTPLGLALALWLIADFNIYWIHRSFHNLGFFWPLHAVHHSAEVLTPFSAYRQHPLALVVTLLAHSAIMGVVQGLIIGVTAPETLIIQIAGINAFLVIANFAMANFHHSHIWISYGRVLEHLFISPAQHQIHHSTNPAHFNRNFGQTLALWDWLFGTLYVTKTRENIRFGLDGRDDAPLMEHRLITSFVSPLSRMARFWRRTTPKR